jgi:rhamnogalacturonyl hydrolase YesR
MWKFRFLPVLFVSLLYISKCRSAFDAPHALNYAIRQYTILSQQLSNDDPSSGFIRTGDPLSYEWKKVSLSDWTVGFYGGTLWTLYALTQDNYWRTLAEEYQERIKDRQFDTSTHDVGFVIMTTFGLSLEYAGNASAVPVIQQAAHSLATRFFPLSGVLRSWNNGPGDQGEVKVIADNMMNLELLFKAADLSGNLTLRDMAISHANKTHEEHFRPDGSTFHVVAFNETTGEVRRKYNHQGLRDNSTWSRGIAWVINGYATSHEITNGTHPQLLEYAEEAAAYVIPRLPSDSVAYWDFDADLGAGYQPRDTSATAIAAHGFLKLFRVTGKPIYWETAEKMLTSLITDAYRADGKPVYRIPALFVNGTVFYHEGESDDAIVYGDFYFLQALKLYNELQQVN